MNKLFARQLEKARNESGAVDLDRLQALVVEAYQAADRDRRRTDRSIALMIEELDQANRDLERMIAERTAALRIREAELEAQNFRFDAAINAMSHALLMFDAKGRLVISNDRYLAMYKLPQDAATPGMSLLELLRKRAEHGMLVENPEAFATAILTAVARGKTTDFLTELPDGRSVTSIVQPLPDGGWVTTQEDITERRTAERRISHMARHDALTDLPNRLAIRDSLSESLTHLRPNERLAVLYLDVDQFKGVNDTLGHATGDELLRAVAERLRTSVEPHNCVARVGGDEFAIVQTGLIRGAAEAALMATRICEAIRAPYAINGQQVIVEATIGIAIGPDDGADASDLLKNADLALYRAKIGGRGTFRFFEPEMDERMKARRSLELALRNALANGQFELHYQPVVDLSDGRITCCEALIRWRDPERGEVPPGEFIPVAEEIGLIVPIGEWVLRQACLDAKSWPVDIRVAVNLSPIQLTNPRLVPLVVNALANAGLTASRLEVEITESVLMQNTDATLSTLHRLRGLGVRISMDDFGTGYSSLSNLRSFPFDKIKIDRSFINGLPDSVDSSAIVRAVAGLARSLDMTTTAEGVETAAQMDQVRLLGCTEMQGYYFSRPRPIEQLNRLLARERGQPEAMSA